MARGIRADLTGRIFTWLLVIGKAPRGKSYDTKWECICKCGKPRLVYGMMLTSGKTKSCGCYSKWKSSITNRTHGMSRRPWDNGVPGYTSWIGAKGRVFCKTNKRYPDYGGRGITMCDRWARRFDYLYADLGPCPPGKSIDRIENNGHYSCGKCAQCEANKWPMNCRWATPKEQANNRRKPRRKNQLTPNHGNVIVPIDSVGSLF